MASVTSLIVIKRFTYRGDAQEEFSNRYYVRMPPPGDDASWRQAATSLLGQEATIFPPSVHIVRIYGYNDDAPNAQAVYSWDLLAEGDETPGTFVPSGEPMAGNEAALLWWKTNRRNARGKFIYLRKYYHSGFVTAGVPDNLDASYRSRLEDFGRLLDPAGAALLGGIRSRTHADPLLEIAASPYSTTRTLKRRGKRPLARA